MNFNSLRQNVRLNKKRILFLIVVILAVDLSLELLEVSPPRSLVSTVISYALAAVIVLYPLFTKGPSRMRWHISGILAALLCLSSGSLNLLYYLELSEEHPGWERLLVTLTVALMFATAVAIYFQWIRPKGQGKLPLV